MLQERRVYFVLQKLYTDDMHILIAYATYSSGTDLATQVIYDILQKDHTVEKKDIRDITEKEIEKADFVLFASPSWRTRNGDGQPHEFFLDFIDSMQNKKISGKRFAIMGLGDSAYTHFCGAVDVLETFVSQLEGTLIIPSLRIDGFYFSQRDNEDRIRDWTHSLQSVL